MQVSVGSRRKGRPSKTWVMTVRNGLLYLKIMVIGKEDNVAWIARILELTQTTSGMSYDGSNRREPLIISLTVCVHG